MISTHITNFIKKYKLQNKTIIVGFSGGYDSLCLLNCLNDLKSELGLTLIAAHFNHNWRGEKAKQEQINCEKFCNSKHIEFFTETADINSKQNETVARELRYAFFERAKNKFNTNIVFTAHNYDDNAETLIYRIVKGTGLTGLKGIQEKRDNYYRPLLEISRTEIEAYCKSNLLCPNNDDSNYDIIHKRNLIRHEILPLFKSINPNVINSLNTLSKVTESELEILNEYISNIKSKIFKDNEILTKEFAKLSKSLKKRIIYDYIYNSEIDYNYELISNATEFLNNAISENKISKFSLTKDRWLYIDGDRITIIAANKKPETEIVISKETQNGIEGEYQFNGQTLVIKKDCSNTKNTGNEFSVYVDLSEYKKLTIRARKDGDIIQPLGSNGKMKLKKYLMSKKIPQYKRDNLVLLCDKNEVLWVGGVGLSDKIKTKTLSTHKIELKNKEIL